MENVHEQDETLPLAPSCFVFLPHWICTCALLIKVMLYETIRNGEF